MAELNVSAMMKTYAASDLVEKGTTTQRVQQLKDKFKQCLIGVAENRMKIYNIIKELKEHFHEYGYKSPAAAVKDICQRSKTWANDFCSQIEAELEILQVTGNPVGSADNAQLEDKKNTSNKISELPTPPQTNEEPSPPPSPEPVKDKTGTVVPDRLLSILKVREDVLAAMNWARKLKGLIVKVPKREDAVFNHLRESGTMNTFVTALDSVHSQLRDCLPDVICPLCEGKKENCTVCCGSGFISEVRWNRDWVKSNDRERIKIVEARLEM